MKFDFQSIFEHIFLRKSCVKMPYFACLKYTDFSDPRVFYNFLKLDMIHLKLGICKIDHYLKFCQRDCQNFASKQNFKFLKKIEILGVFRTDLHRICKGNLTQNLMKSQTSKIFLGSLYSKYIL